MRTARRLVVPIITFCLGAALLATARHALAAEPADLAAAREAVAKGNYADGLKAMDKLLAAKPAPDAELAARSLRVQALADTGRFADALAEAAQAEALAPKSPDALALHAEALLDLGRTKDAAERLARARTADPEHLRTHFLALELAKQTGDRDALGRETDFFFRLHSQGKAKTAEALTAVALAAERDDPHGTWRAYGQAHQADPKHLDAFLYGGFHCLGKYAWKLAADEFQAALKLNPHAAVAHAGMAIVALHNGDFSKAEQAVEAALKVNPTLPLAHELKAALLTMEEQHAESLKEIQAVLAVNPNRLSALALLAAHHEALGHAAERDQAVQRVLALNPRFAELYTSLAQAGERRRQFPLAVAWARKAIALDPDDWEGYYLAGMNLLRIGEEREGYQLLERAFKLNPFNIWAYNMLSVLDRDFKQKRFERFESDHFVVKLPEGQAAVLWPYVRTVLDEAWARFTKKYAAQPVGPKEYGGKVLVLIFPDHQQFSARTVGLPGLGALGACFGQVITLPSPRLARMGHPPFNWRRVLEHEFCHAVTLQKTGYRIPRWFTEGISTFEEQEPQIRWDPLLVRAVADNAFLPLERLNVGFSRPKTPMQVPVSYYQSGLIVEWLEKTCGPDALRKVCDLLAEGRQPADALAAVTGKPLAELNKLTDVFIRDYAKQIKMSPPPDPKDLPKLEEAVKKNDKDAEAWSRLAAARLAMRKPDDARKAAQKALDADPKLARAHAILGLLAAEVDRKPDEAKACFLRAKEADPNHFGARLYLGLLARDAGRSDEAIAELDAARRLFPRFADPAKSPHRLLADLYVKARQPDKAIAVLQEQIHIHNDRLESFLQLGGLLAAAGKPADAAAAFLGAVYIDPFAPPPHQGAAKAFESLGAFDRAATEFTVLTALDPRDLAALLGRARTLAAAGKAPEARQALAAVRELDPANAEALEIEKRLPR